MASVAILASGAQTSVAKWPPPARALLPAFPSITSEQPSGPYASCWAAEPYASTLPAGIPAVPDRRFHRGNVIGVRVPGLTEGDDDGLGGHTFDYTWYWVRYSDAQMRLACDYHAQGCGYTHTSLSIPQTENYGKSIDDLIRVMRYAHSRGMFVSLNVGSDGLPFSEWEPEVNALLEAGALLPGRDLLCAAWQIDKWYSPADGVQLIKDVSAWGTPRDLLTVVHWGGGYSGWAESCAMWDADTEAKWGITNRFTFQQALKDELAGHYGQCYTEASIDQVQSWISKIVVAFPPGMFFVAAEMDMQAEADDPAGRPEIYGDLKAYLAQCTAQNFGVSVSSFNGSRGVNGQVVL